MTPAEFDAALKELQWSKAHLARYLEAGSGHRVQASTFTRYSNGKRKVPPGLVCLLKVLIVHKMAFDNAGCLVIDDSGGNDHFLVDTREEEQHEI